MKSDGCFVYSFACLFGFAAPSMNSFSSSSSGSGFDVQKDVLVSSQSTNAGKTPRNKFKATKMIRYR
jgi:hypothetical protein